MHYEPSYDDDAADDGCCKACEQLIQEKRGRFPDSLNNSRMAYASKYPVYDISNGYLYAEENPQFRHAYIRRNNQGFASRSGIPDAYDNRYELLHAPYSEYREHKRTPRPIPHSNFGESFITKGKGQYESSSSQSSVYSESGWEDEFSQAPPPFGYSYAEGTRRQGSRLDYFFDDPYLQDENLDELESIPAYDDIPYALFLTGRVDRRTAARAMRKQRQRDALQQIMQQTDARKMYKNKNFNEAKCMNKHKGELIPDEKQHDEMGHKTPNDLQKLEPVLDSVLEAKKGDATIKDDTTRYSRVNNHSEKASKIIYSEGQENNQLIQPMSENGVEKFIREKRLNNLKSVNPTKISEFDRSHDGTVRGIENISHQTHMIESQPKSVKPKVFTSNFTSFQRPLTSAANLQNEKTADVRKSKETSTVRSETDPKHTISMKHNNIQDDNHEKENDRVSYVKKDKSSEMKQSSQGSKQDNNQKDTFLDITKRETKMTECKKQLEEVDRTSQEISAQQPDYIPVAMKLFTKNKMLPKTTRRKVMESRDENSEFAPVPIAMKLLRQSKKMHESQKSLMKRMPSGSKGINTLLSTLLGTGPYDDFIEDESYLDQEATRPLKANRNKNENFVRKPTETSKNDESSSKPSKNEKEQSDICQEITKHPPSDKSKIKNKKEDTHDTVAYNRHKVFAALKMAKGDREVRCTGCGRSDCQGSNIRKMREIMHIAQQGGFEVRDVIPDGNCMFAAVVDQLNMYGDDRFDHKSLREAAVLWLVEHPYNEDGTHYSSFVSEKWETYIQRMMSVGEWGDHLVLRAVVEVVGHTIRILSVSGDETRWTTLEPNSINASNDSIHLVLGHVGEFHYVSLRPCGNEESAAKNDGPKEADFTTEDIADMRLEGSESVEMFKEDYIDIWSDIPAAHFSFLLKSVIPMKCMNDAAMLSSEILSYQAPEFSFVDYFGRIPTTSEYGGSLVEGVYLKYVNVNNLDVDTADELDCLTVYTIRSDMAVMEIPATCSLNGQYLTIDTAGVHSGYTKIQERSIFSYMPHNPAMSSQCTMLPLTKGKRAKVMHLVSLRCAAWPQVAKEWITRVRSEGWPTEVMIKSIEAESCLIIPCPHKKSQSPETEWQFCFALSERKLFRECVSKNQKYCYILFDSLCRQALKSRNLMSSSYLKSVFFYACERIPTEYWETSPGACVLYMLNELLRFLSIKSLPNYFISTNNIIDHLTDAELKEVEDQLHMLRSQPVLFLRQINEDCQTISPYSSAFDKVSSDYRAFQYHRSLRISTLEVFIPVAIEVAHDYIKRFQFETGFELLSEAFQYRLSVSTCDDAVSFEVFIQSAANGLDLSSLVWFTTYADRHLKGQLSKSLTRQLCGHLTLIKLGQILPSDVAGSFREAEVPQSMTNELCAFCHEFARFLVCTNKLSEVLPLLYHCHKLYLEKQDRIARGPDKEQKQEVDFTDESMFFIYVAMLKVYIRQGQTEFFRSVMPTVEAIVYRINKRWGYSCFSAMCEVLSDTQKQRKASEDCLAVPADYLDSIRIQMFRLWPNYSQF